MKEPDVVLSGLASLPAVTPPEELSRRIRAAGHARLVPAKVHPLFGWMVAASVLAYLSWALLYTRTVGASLGPEPEPARPLERVTRE